MPASAGLPVHVIDALAAGRHGDPFAVLGPHAVAGGDEGGAIVRAFRPDAVAIAVIDTRTQQATPMNEGRARGFFEAQVAADPLDFEYRLRLTAADGSTRDLDDPYRFSPVLTPFDEHLFTEGTNIRAFRRLGAHPMRHGGVGGVHFAVWAPNARRVSVVGDFNGWDGRLHPMRALVGSGIWEIFIPELTSGQHYKFEVVPSRGPTLLKADPYGRFFEVPPRTASTVYSDDYRWGDAPWMQARRERGVPLREPMAIYEVHLGSWRKGEDGRTLGYRELAETLVPYVREQGFTHLELMPVMEHPYGGSWGYQVVGFFAPTSRYGRPDDFKYFVDACHQAGLGVILDWVPGHFPKDMHGLARFDGTALYEHADPRQGEHQDWGTLVFNYARREVRSFLLSNALFWIEEFHVDGLRVDAVASMLYLDYSRKAGEWIPNRYGGRENLEAISFLQDLNRRVADEHPDVAMIAEESTAWPGVSRAVHLGGLGFSLKWNMGWMHDMLDYTRQDPVHRRFHHNRITFSLLYAFSERFLLPFSHDEVVHGKGSLVARMPGDRWQKHAGLRALLGYMYAHPGKKLLFMGAELAQPHEWNHDGELDWATLEDPLNGAVQHWVRELNACYRVEPTWWTEDFDAAGFRWIDANDSENSVISFLRRVPATGALTLAVVNFTPVVRTNYRLGVPHAGPWRERLNSDALIYGGSGVGNPTPVTTKAEPSHGHPLSLSLTLPPLAFLLLKPDPDPASPQPIASSPPTSSEHGEAAID